MRKPVNLIYLAGIPLLVVGIVFAASWQQATVKVSTNIGESAQKTKLTAPIRIVQPPEDARLPQLTATYVCGSVTLPGRLLINEVEVPVHPDGGFVTMVNLTPGRFAIKAELITGAATYYETRNIIVAGPEEAAPLHPLTIQWVEPRSDQELLPGDDVNVAFKGSPGMKAYFKVQGIRGKFPMLEDGAGSGIYRGVYRIGKEKLPSPAAIKVTLVNRSNRKKSMTAPGRISLFPEDVPVMAKVIASGTVLRSGPVVGPQDQAGYEMFPPPGTILQLSGRCGNEYRVRLTATKTLWVTADLLQLLPKGTSASLIAIGNISVTSAGQVTQIRIPLQRKLPFRIDTDPKGSYLDLSLFGAFSNTDRIANQSGDVIKELRWFQDTAETYRLRILTTAHSWWSYDVRYEAEALVVELRTPPPVAPGVSPLNGLTVAVDAGHASGTGAIGCTGYAEGDANMAMALNLKAKLLEKGAKVIMVRPGKADVPLRERPKIAWQNRADILLSLHNNSLGYGGNPLIKHGFEIYYFTPMSLALAREIHGAYKARFDSDSEYNLPDGGLHFGNFALLRTPQMPAVLIESAYMIFPQEEAYLKSDGFHSACSEAIIAGLQQYASRMRPVIPKQPVADLSSRNE